jgi:plasmid stabilization system protein ParE
MARVELAPEVLEAFERFLDHMAHVEIADAAARIVEIVQTIDILTHSPLIGRLACGGKRELVIGRDARGYVALYRYGTRIDTVFVLAIRSQREAGYERKR